MGLTEVYVIVLRILHVGLGVFWAGAGLFSAWFLAPAVKAAGPDGGKVMGKLSTATPWSKVISAAAVVTVLSGILLYVQFWVGEGRSDTLQAMSFGLGGVFGLAAMILGGAFIGRTSAKIVRLSQELQASAGGPPPPAKVSEMAALQASMERYTNISAILLTITVILMAISRYLQF